MTYDELTTQLRALSQQWRERSNRSNTTIEEARAIDLCSDELDDVLALLAAVPPPPPSGWQQMETAPKDGRRVLCIGRTGHHDVLEWSDRATGRYQWTDGEYTYDPVWWMPLPPPPEPYPPFNGTDNMSGDENRS